MARQTKIVLIIGSFILLLLAISYYRNVRNDQLTENAVYTVGKVSKIFRVSGGVRTSTSYKIEYKYYYKGDWIENSGPLEATVGEVRNGKPIIGAYYSVKYDPNDLSLSKILITNRPITRDVAFKSYTKIYGNIESINPTYPGAVRVNVTYRFKDENYKVETILSKDSLPCGTLEECKESGRIKLFVSNNFPYFTDLFYKSSNRQHLE
ncbi:hypothetical protein [Kordia antarctica]|nr:hypothetical protein [Kordia antarctica]